MSQIILFFLVEAASVPIRGQQYMSGRQKCVSAYIFPSTMVFPCRRFMSVRICGRKCVPAYIRGLTVYVDSYLLATLLSFCGSYLLLKGVLIFLCFPLFTP